MLTVCKKSTQLHFEYIYCRPSIYRIDEKVLQVTLNPLSSNVLEAWEAWNRG
jgi:hypothetical protein